MSLRVAVLGHDGPADAVVAALVAAGADVVAIGEPAAPGIRSAASVSDAVADADLVLSFAAPLEARKVAAEAAPALRQTQGPEAGAVYADLTRGTPGGKRAIGALFADDVFADASADVSETDPPALRVAASGPGAAHLVDLLAPLGLDAERISGRVGDAAARMLLAALLERELAAAVVDVLWAAQSMQQQAWASEEILRQFDALSADSVRGFVADLSRNGKRRQIEMMDVTEMLGETDYTSTLGNGVALTYSRLLHSVKIPFSPGR